jgi:hypothetical protein
MSKDKTKVAASRRISQISPTQAKITQENPKKTLNKLWNKSHLAHQNRKHLSLTSGRLVSIS